MTNEEYIRANREEDARLLALRGAPEGIDVRWCLQQVEGWQLARRKLPTWARTEGLWYPVRLSMEQCSSEAAAQYKRRIVERLIPKAERRRMADLTGGLGVDFWQLATLFGEATYVETVAELRRLALHNLPLLGVTDFSVQAPPLDAACSLFFLDPARRDDVGRKTVAIEDCSPNVIDLQDRLLAHGGWLMVKLSPMLDIRQALRQLRGVAEVHVVSVEGECKELLFAMHRDGKAPTVHCVNLGTEEDTFVCPIGGVRPAVVGRAAIGAYLYEPNASVLKAGVQDGLCEAYGVAKLHAMSHLFVADRRIEGFPGRCFRIVGMSDFGKRNLKQLLGDLRKANLTVRNFPSSVADLRRRLRLAEGGEDYLFATTLADGSHALLRGLRAED